LWYHQQHLHLKLTFAARTDGPDMVFLAKEQPDVPTKDLISWYFVSVLTTPLDEIYFADMVYVSGLIH
jgi:hypothetical protein